MLVGTCIIAALTAIRGYAFPSPLSRGAAAHQNAADQTRSLQAMLPRGVNVNIHLANGTSATTLNRLLPANSVECVRSTPIPPDTSDCTTLVSAISNFSTTTVTLQSFHCSWSTYRSCSMYNCATKCAGFDFTMAEWAAVLEGVRGACVNGRGMSGFHQRTWAECGPGQVPFVAGIENIGAQDIDGGTRVPPVRPCG